MLKTCNGFDYQSKELSIKLNVEKTLQVPPFMTLKIRNPQLKVSPVTQTHTHAHYVCMNGNKEHLYFG